ncbi:rod shape-determining protein RodA [Wolbachia endosymbiont of Pentidionis agamae]|uniref:rod shape-determining protein RodA n=1 Tax=Wolbachia endosymbiont of Pentidionis agamae TaxID=3110435 RepID=UPI002FD1708F
MHKSRKLEVICWLLIINVSALFLIGLSVQYSCAGGKWAPLIHQLIIFFIFSFLIIIMLFLKSEFFLRYSYVIYTFTIIALLITNCLDFHVAGTTRWLRIGSMNLQPSECTKISIILALARYFHNRSVYRILELRTLFKAIAIILLPVILVLMQPNLGTATIMLFIGASIIFTVILRKKHLITCVVIGISTIPAFWPFMRSYHKKRILSFLDLSTDPLGIGYNAKQSQIAIGSGGLFGKGFVNGSQTQLGFLPAKRTDFVFSVLSEEWGFIGSMVVMLLYTLLIITILTLSIQVKDYFSKLISIGVFAFFAAHFFVNIGMTIGFLPIIGDPLPLLSYGGSITSASLICIGLLLVSIKAE